MAKSRQPSRPVAVPNVLQRQIPANPMALLMRAQQQIAAGQHAEAGEVLSQAMLHPVTRPEAHYLLAVSALMRQQLDTALNHAQDAVTANPADARYQFTLGRVHKARHDLDAAESAYRMALHADSHYPDAMVSLGILRKTRGDFAGAIEWYERALAINPRMMSAHANLANAMALRAEKQIADGFDEEADQDVVDAQGRAVALDPRNPLLHRNYGVLLTNARRHREAISAFNEALTLDPADMDSCLRLGALLQAIGDTPLAREAYLKWLERNPPKAPVLRALADALTRSGAVDEALGWAQKAIALDPDISALLTLGSTLMQSRRLEESLARCREAIELSAQRPDVYSTLLLGMSYLHEDPQSIFAVHAEFGGRLPKAGPRPGWRVRPERLRVGYVSGDFVRHSVSYFMAGLLELHDRQRFEIVCYHNNARSDSVTDHFKSLGHQWVECDGTSDEALRRRIVADGIDILIDLSGHTSGTRYPVFAMGAAPVQVGYLGYPTVSGVPAMDFRVTDGVIDPGDQPALPHDAPLALPRTMFCYRPDEAPELEEPPMLKAGHVTFGSFNNIAKVTDHTLTLWAAAMNAVSGSRLLLKSTAMAQASNRLNIERFMGALGIAAERLDLQPWKADKRGHLGTYNDVDIALDTYPYNGATTTCEALWMGVTVVSRRGATHTSRMGASLLGAIGKPDWVADTDDAFVTHVVRLAGDPDGLARWRSQCRATLQASELFDEAGFTRGFEDILDLAWARRGAATPAAPPEAT